MEKIVVEGGVSLKGEIFISGAKNAALPLMAASLLTDQPLCLHHVPALSDVSRMEALLAQHGVDVQKNAAEKTLTLQASIITNTVAPYDIVSKMRACILVLGPLLARCGEAKVSLPGGCAIGIRPLNVHIESLRSLGAEIDIEGGYICAKVSSQGLRGAHIAMPLVTVNGTENVMMAAVLAKGSTIIKNAAKEPEVSDLAHCLNAMGAKISGIGTDTLVIDGVEQLGGTTHAIIPDRIEAATYAVASAITHGDIVLRDVVFDDLFTFWNHLSKAGALIEAMPSAHNPAFSDVRVRMPGEIQGVDMMTEPYPGFPTDIQAQFMALMTLCNGAAMITETIFENRLMHVPELCRMCADITVHKTSTLVRGVKELVGSHVMATDLRASVSLILAGLAAKGTTTVQRIYHIDRGYERVEEKLRQCGAVMERVPTEA
ncbi:UDP-N-acetylglucosamine 1-carboxyvinyltransferase [Alphaproteobacteria bacterium]|nr:UDP-N-acetylglucosamine 1-carboxyvinyltransferase [Alphaproteobacteria bacterium]GHS97761.1 UDP-N-acetylglucosamine 1-carboxyvinyltransferase [Alphaproteobacteria bacterium]